jgi:hypothetical protein
LYISLAEGSEAMVPWHIDEFLFFRGYVWVAGWISRERPLRNLVAVFPGAEPRTFSGCLSLPSIDIETILGPPGRHARFSCHVAVPSSAEAMALRILAEFESGEWIDLEGFRSQLLASDPYHALQATFYSMVQSIVSGRVLELGSRNRSGVIRKSLIPSHIDYVGIDILAGENVDIIGDAHELSRLFPRCSFDAVFATSVFEHLMMPWKVAIEINHILKQNGLVMVTSHQSWPLHETPWDYWRFSDQAWHALFNLATGFEIIEVAFGERASIVPHALHSTTQDLDLQPAFCGSAVLCRKIADSSLEWKVDRRDLTDTTYPA